ncbi:c-type cytochrome [Paenibacillus sp. UNC451MF]|uniref:c-type cytochrome n=1 Tax=Paenibacillus sp. UNC451MF TaxID=1449063 RepID=UPI00068A8BD1|nr:cytochrome c [Paenibacillus sp. UNC451MF]
MKLHFAAMTAIISTALVLSACSTKPGNEGQQPAAVPSSNTGTPAQGSTAQATPTPTPTPTSTPSQTQGTPAGSDSKTTPAATTINAEAIVKQTCISCHGDTLDGKGSEKKNLQKIGAKMNKEQIVNQITNGGGGMPGFKGKLKEEEIAAVAAWLEAKK